MAIEIKHLRPGDDGFEELAAQVTPLHKIRKHCFGEGMAIFAPSEPYDRRRHESVNKIRGVE